MISISTFLPCMMILGVHNDFKRISSVRESSKKSRQFVSLNEKFANKRVCNMATYQEASYIHYPHTAHVNHLS